MQKICLFFRLPLVRVFMVIFTFASNLFFNVPEKGNSITKVNLELVSKELNHFGLVAGLFGRSRVMLGDLCYLLFLKSYHDQKLDFLKSGNLSNFR